MSLELTFGGLEMFDQVVDVAVHGGGDVTARVADAVIGDAVLRKVVGTDFFTTVTGADEAATMLG